MYSMAGLVTISPRGISPFIISPNAGWAMASSSAKHAPIVATSAMTNASR